MRLLTLGAAAVGHRNRRRVTAGHNQVAERRSLRDPRHGNSPRHVDVERHSKLVLNIAMGKRDQATTDGFVEGIRDATAPSYFQIILTR